MEEKRKYVVYLEESYETIERVAIMTETQVNALNWFMDKFDINGGIDLIEEYEGEEI